MHLLDHEFAEVGQHVLKVVRLAAQPGGHVLQDGFFAEIETDHLGHIGVDRLVVGHTGAHGVADGHVARAVGLHEAGAAQRGIGTKHLWVKKIIVHAAVDDMHALQPARSAHVDEAALHHQVLPLNQLHAHLLRKEGVLEIRAVEHAGREHHHRGRGCAGRCAGTQGVEQQVGVMGHGCHLVHAEQLGEQPHHHAAVLQHVAHAAGHAQVVLQHVVHALALRVGSAHDVDASNVRIDVARHLDACHLGAVLGVVQHQVRRDEARTQDVLAVVDIVDEAVERRHALHQPALHARPLLRRNDARHQVERDQSLVARAALVLVSIHGEGDAHTPEDHLGLGAAGLHGLGRLARQPVAIALVMLSHIAAVKGQDGVHLVKFLHGQPPLNPE